MKNVLQESELGEEENERDQSQNEIEKATRLIEERGFIFKPSYVPDYGDGVVSGTIEIVPRIAMIPIPRAELKFVLQKGILTITAFQVWNVTQEKKDGCGYGLLAYLLSKFGHGIRLIAGQLRMDNLEEYQKGIKQGLSPEEAVKLTPAYKIRAKFGYTELVQCVPNLVSSAPFVALTTAKPS